jgi:hypothetical protein
MSSNEIIEILVQQINASFENQENEKVKNGSIVIFTNPSVGPNSIKNQLLFDEKGDRIRYEYGFDENAGDLIIEYFKSEAKEEGINKIDFHIENQKVVKVIQTWDRAIIDDFESNLPKSKRGKIKAWYLP